MKNLQNNIIFIGFMGVGKTTFGRKIALKYNKNFLDLDKYIVLKENKPISEIFKEFGEEYFREKETLACDYVKTLKNTIISTGGGIIKNSENIQKLKEVGTLIYLKSSVDRIYKNVERDRKRPILQTSNKYETVRMLLNERELLYQKSADLILNLKTRNMKQNLSIIEDILIQNNLL